MFESICIEFFAYVSGGAKAKVWVFENELHFSREVGFKPEKYVRDAVSAMPAEEFVKRIEALDILSWKKEYTPDEIWMDGESWGIKYDDSEHRTYKVRGENAYPACWKQFMELMTEAVGEFWDYSECL
jgi:hypothetical protein